MPRSRRDYGDPAASTLANAIAYVHIVQQTKGLHMSTVSKLMSFYEFASGQPHYRFTPEALELAKAAPLWQAYEWLAANGYRLRSFPTRHSLRSIEFWNPTLEKIAYTNRWGDILIVPENDLWGGNTVGFNPSKGSTYSAEQKEMVS